MIGLEDLDQGDIIEYINPTTSQFGVGTFVRSINRRTGDKRTDIIVENTLGSKTTITEQNVRWGLTALRNRKGAFSNDQS